MSFDRHQFYKFGFDPEQRLSQFRKRFDDFRNTSRPTMHERSPNGWPTAWQDDINRMRNKVKNLSDLSDQRPSNRSSSDASEGIRIPVFHEKSSERDASADNDCETSSTTSSSSNKTTGSNKTAGSHRTTSSNSSSVFHGSDHPQEVKNQPRVHHIPIEVEPRDGYSSSPSSGYTSDGHKQAERHPSRSSSSSSHRSAAAAETQRAASPAKSVSSSHSNTSVSSLSESPKPNVRTIPIQVETDAKSRLGDEKPSMKMPAFSQSSIPRAGRKTSGPHVTRIPVFGPNTDAGAQPTQAFPQNEANAGGEKVDPLKLIQNILSDLKHLQQQVVAFKGTHKDKEYRYLDEMLTRCMIKLDTIDIDGKEEIRKTRKEAIVEVQKCIAMLELKAKSEIKSGKAGDEQSNKEERQEKQEEREDKSSETKPAPLETSLDDASEEEAQEKREQKEKPDAGAGQQCGSNSSDAIEEGN